MGGRFAEGWGKKRTKLVLRYRLTAKQSDQSHDVAMFLLLRPALYLLSGKVNGSASEYKPENSYCNGDMAEVSQKAKVAAIVIY